MNRNSPLNCLLYCLQHRLLYRLQRAKKRMYFLFAAILFALLGACTDKEVEPPHVLELKAIPQSITISDEYFHAKPFAIRAKYSDKTEKNITSRVSWSSENSSLVTINAKGEMQKSGECLQKKCVVSLIATDPDSGKSLRLVVNMSQSSVKKPLQQKNQKLGTTDLTATKTPKKEGLPAAEGQLSADEAKTEKPNVDETNAEETNIEEQNNKPGLSNLQFSPLVESKNTTNKSFSWPGNESAELADATENDIIQRLEFKKNDVLLISGETYTANIVARDSVGKIHVSHRLSYDCVAVDERNPSIILLPGCQLIAVEPGEANIAIRLQDTDGNSSIETGNLSVRVNPVFVNASFTGFNQLLNLSANNTQMWIQVFGISHFSYYRAEISGNLTPGYRLSVFNRLGTQFKTCINTVPMQAQSAACYFQASDDDVLIVVENPLHQFAEVNVNLAPADELLFQNLSSLIMEESPVSLMPGEFVSGFIFANETGGNNQHFYTLEKEAQPRQGLQVNLSYFSTPVKLSVTWLGGFCNEKMMKKNSKGVSCEVPAHVVGRILISIDGNNGGFGMLNGQAAIAGGADYQLLVSEPN